MRSRSSMPSRTSSSLDLVVTMSCGLTLQICLIIALSFRCRRRRFSFVNGQISLAWSIALRTQKLYTRPHVLKERWREERTGSRSLNFFQAVFTRVVDESSQPPAAESMSLGSKRKLPPQACQVRPGLPSVALAPCTSIVRVHFHAFEPTAFLVHPVLAAIAEDAVAAHSSATDSTWKLA